MQEKIIVICGPTATGKSALAVELALLHHGEVISADSRQVYRGLDIGSAKITLGEMQGIPHHMIDIVDPNHHFSVAEFQEKAREKMRSIFSRGNLPILCGGTGLYIDAIMFDTDFPTVPPNPTLRAALEQKSTIELFEELQQSDPKRAHTIDPHNKMRLVRALEIIHSLGTVPSLDTRTPYNQTLWIGLTLPKEVLQKNIRERMEKRIPALFDEIKKLHTNGISWERLDSFGLEYRYGAQYVQGIITLEQFTELLATKTWQFAKRQMTWFQRNENIHWMNPLSDKQKILKQVQDFVDI